MIRRLSRPALPLPPRRRLRCARWGSGPQIETPADLPEAAQEPGRNRVHLGKYLTTLGLPRGAQSADRLQR